MTVDLRASAVLLGLLLLPGCYVLRPSHGGGQEVRPPTERRTDPADVLLPAGYRIEVVAAGLTYPTGVAFDDRGTPHVVEAGYAYGEDWTEPRLLRVEPGGSTAVVARGGQNGPWNGVVWHAGAFLVAEGGEREGGRILRIAPSGETRAIVEGLPSVGDHHTNGPAVGPDGRIYFGQGTATNSAVVGKDSADFGWLERHPGFHDVPCRDVTLAGRNFTTDDARRGRTGKVSTGAFSPYGTPTTEGQVVKGEVPCTGAILRVGLEGGKPELVAWGLRNPFGLAFGPDGALYVTENGFDERGSRPVWGGGDYLWRIEEGAWYGWPDHAGGVPLVQHDQFDPPAGPRPEPLLAKKPGRPPRPVAALGVHSSSNGLDLARSREFGFEGQAFVAQFGDMAPPVGKVLHPVGFKVVRVELDTGAIEDFAVNRSDELGPASRLRTGGLERPVAVRFDPSGRALYVVDFGVMTTTERGPRPVPRTGVLWKITREVAP
jgi:glucose/arabinose dehydrogenase